MIYAQENFVQGHIVTLEQDTVAGLIDYRNWRKTPEAITFKIDSVSKAQQYEPFQLRAFKVGDERYISRMVEIDRTPNDPEELVSVPITESDHLFLLQYMDAETSLYYFMGEKQHFYILRDGDTRELIYRKLLRYQADKKYRVSDEQYKIQLKSGFSDCPEILDDIERLEYKKSDMIGIFEKYNRCKGTPILYTYEVPKTRLEIQLTLGPAFSQPALYTTSRSIGEYSKSFSPIFGISFDLIFPHNREKWSMYNELVFTYRYSKEARTDTKLGGSYLKMTSLMRYRFLETTSRPFINFGISNAYGLYTNDEINQLIINSAGGSTTQKARKYLRGFVAGLGANLGKFICEVRYEWDRAPQASVLSYQVQTMYLVFGFDL